MLSNGVLGVPSEENNFGKISAGALSDLEKILKMAYNVGTVWYE